jgi:cation:H+ antiporter
MISALLFALAGLVLLYFGAEWLVKGAASLALRWGLSPLIIGLTVVAFGTSAPEMAVSIKAAFSGSPDLALGNVVGSNISNIGLILSLVCLIHPLRVHRQVFTFDGPAAIWSSVLLIFLLMDHGVSRFDGVLLVGLLCLYVLFSVRKSKNNTGVATEETGPIEERPLYVNALLIALGIAIMVLGADFLVDGAVTIARSFGVSEAVIGLTMVAIGTSLPEMATSLVAAFKKEADIAVGNIIGSNIFNILSVLGFSAAIHPIHPKDIGGTDLAAMLLLTVILIPLGWKSLLLQRWHGALLLLIYAGYLYTLG